MSRQLRTFEQQWEQALWFDAAVPASTAQVAEIYGTDRNDRLRGTASDDVFHLEQGGNDKAISGSGNDTFYFGDTYTSRDVVLAGEGEDRIVLERQRPRTLEIGTGNIKYVETIELGAHDYRIALDEDVTNITIDGRQSTDLTLDGKPSLADLRIFGGAGYDLLTGGAGDDLIVGGAGADRIRGGRGNDVFEFTAITDSQKYDRESDFLYMDVGDRIRISIPGLDQLHYGSSDADVGGVQILMFDSQELTRIRIFDGEATKGYMVILVDDYGWNFDIVGNELVIVG